MQLDLHALVCIGVCWEGRGLWHSEAAWCRSWWNWQDWSQTEEEKSRSGICRYVESCSIFLCKHYFWYFAGLL